jgi:hypothetical protein
MQNLCFGPKCTISGYQSCEASILVHWTPNDVWKLLGGFGIESSHTQKIENGRAKDAGSKSPEVADPIFILQASRFGQTPFVDTEATNTNPT